MRRSGSSNEDKLGKIAYVEIYCYYHMRNRKRPEDVRATVPPHLDWEMWTGPAPMRDYNSVVHPRGWRAFMEYGNGIVGDMCIHMLDMVRWMLGLGWPKAVSSSGGILVDKASIANISDTQEATFDFGDLKVHWVHRSWGQAPDPEYRGGPRFTERRGTLKASVHKWDFTPRGQGKAESGEVVYELEEFPEDKTEDRLEKHVAPAVRGHMRDFLTCIAKRGRQLPVADIEQGHISTTSCILANLALQVGRTLRWHEKAGTIVGDEEATTLMARPYRGPWVHP